MKCGNRKCAQPAVCRCSWGPWKNPNENEEILCQTHLDNLWMGISGIVTEGVISYHCTSLTESDKGEQGREIG